jgi:hypothetical protein
MAKEPVAGQNSSDAAQHNGDCQNEHIVTHCYSPTTVGAGSRE